MIAQLAERPVGRAYATVRDRLGRTPYWSRVIVVLVAIGAAVISWGDDYVTAVAVSVATYAMLGLGLNIVVGYAGLLDLGYAAFFAIGAYTSALLMTQAHWNFFTTLPFAVLFTGTAGAILGYPTLRLRSDYLAIVTLGFGEMTRITFNNWEFAGGMLIGLLEAYTTGYLSGTWEDVVVFGVLITVLIVKPTGLFGERVAERM